MIKVSCWANPLICPSVLTPPIDLVGKGEHPTLNRLSDQTHDTQHWTDEVANSLLITYTHILGRAPLTMQDT